MPGVRGLGALGSTCPARRIGDAPVTKHTPIGSVFDADVLRAVQASTSADLVAGGPGLAVHALRARLADEVWLMLSQAAVGVGKLALPTDLRLALALDLIDEHRFDNGAVRVACRVRS